MRIVRHIRIDKGAVDTLRKLECVESVNDGGGDISVRIKEGFTDGRLTVVKGEYLCMFESGKWQRFGSEAFGKTYQNPRKEVDGW